MAIEGIDELCYGVEDRALGVKFFTDWGLNLVEESAEKHVFETLNGSRIILRDIDDPVLDPAFEAGSTLRQAVWGVEDVETLTLLRERLQEVPGFVDEGERFGCIDPNGMSIRFQLSKKRPVTVESAGINRWGDIERVDQPSTFYDRATPIEIGHFVMFVGDVHATEAFYQDKLGFVTSDRYPDRGAFMRCAPRGGHHDLFLLQPPNGKRGLNHVAFTVRDIHEVFGGGLHISRCGWKTQLGPGRHPVSSAYFWYFLNPCGGLIEYYADEDALTENWHPREFEPGPTVFAEWAVDGGLDGVTRRQVQAKAPDGKFMTDRTEK